MAASSADAHPFVIFGARYRVVFPILNDTGSLVTGASSLDSEVSQDQGTFADCSNEATEIATSSGMYYIDMISTETDTKCSTVIVKTATSGAHTTPIVLYPVRLPQVRTGTAQAGGSATVTLDSGASAIDNFYAGCYVNITNNTPSNALGQARLIVSYVGSTKVATVEQAWGTNPSSSSTFEVLLPPGATGGAAKVNAVAWNSLATVELPLCPTVAGNKADVSSSGGVAPDWGNVKSPSTTVSLSGTTVKTATDVETDTQDIQSRLPAALSSGRIDASIGAVQSAAITAAGIASNAITSAKVDSTAITAIQSGLATASTLSAVKTQTDKLTFTGSTKVQADIKSINGTTVNGDGSSTPWGP